VIVLRNKSNRGKCRLYFLIAAVDDLSRSFFSFVSKDVVGVYHS
jgi:hypothetical protein